MNNLKIVFCGLSKNCGENLIKNTEFILNFKKKYQSINVYLIVVDSDSIDGNLDYLINLNNLQDITVVFKNDLEKTVSSRIERIAICRNIGLDYIRKNFNTYSNLIYIPFDNDIDIFKYLNIEKFMDLVMQTKNSDSDALFPVSLPYYYDIFALRAEGWVSYNSQLLVKSLKTKFRYFSFLWNYFYIFRHQLSPFEISKKNFKVTSAFGGIGIYDLSSIDKLELEYRISDKDIDYYSEHIEFNKKFKTLNIETNWKIPAPFQHIEFKQYNYINKVKYILRTINSDFLKNKNEK